MAHDHAAWIFRGKKLTFSFLYVVILENFVLVFKKIQKKKKKEKKKKSFDWGNEGQFFGIYCTTLSNTPMTS